MATKDEEYILFQADFVKEAQPFGLDFGGSVIKIAYKLDGAAPDENGQARVYLKQYSREDLPEAVTFLKDTVTLPDPSAPPEARTLCLTGLGTFEYTGMFEKELGIKVKNIWEMTLSNRMLHFLLTTQPDEQIFFPSICVRDEGTEEFLDNFKGVAEGIMGPDPEFLPPWKQAGYRKWPCLMLTLGSGFTFIPMLENGRVMAGLFSASGGRSFHGLGTLLTGAKTFDELVELAAAGDDHNVNVYIKDITPNKENKDGKEQEQDGGLYADMTQDLNVYQWGWAVNKDPNVFKRKELAKALLVNTATEIVLKSLLMARAAECTNIVLLGSFAKNKVVREHLESTFIQEQATSELFDPRSSIRSATFRTLRAGSHLGALGAMFSNVNLGDDFKMPGDKKDN